MIKNDLEVKRLLTFIHHKAQIKMAYEEKGQDVSGIVAEIQDAKQRLELLECMPAVERVQ